LIRTKNFSPEYDTKLLCTCGHEKCDRRSVRQSVLDRIQLIRNDLRRSLVVTSGGRCPYHPNEWHRHTPADHQNCVALDLQVTGGIERMDLVRLGMRHGATAIGVAKTFVHLGWRDTKHYVMWTY
jgi:hypothetical protein